MRKQKSCANTKALLICHSLHIGYKTTILYQKKRNHFLKTKHQTQLISDTYERLQVH